MSVVQIKVTKGLPKLYNRLHWNAFCNIKHLRELLAFSGDVTPIVKVVVWYYLFSNRHIGVSTKSTCLNHLNHLNHLMFSIIAILKKFKYRGRVGVVNLCTYHGAKYVERIG